MIDFEKLTHVHQARYRSATGGEGRQRAGSTVTVQIGSNRRASAVVRGGRDSGAAHVTELTKAVLVHILNGFGVLAATSDPIVLHASVADLAAFVPLSAGCKGLHATSVRHTLDTAHAPFSTLQPSAWAERELPRLATRLAYRLHDGDADAAALLVGYDSAIVENSVRFIRRTVNALAAEPRGVLERWAMSVLWHAGGHGGAMDGRAAAAAGGRQRGATVVPDGRARAATRFGRSSVDGEAVVEPDFKVDPWFICHEHSLQSLSAALLRSSPAAPDALHKVARALAQKIAAGDAGAMCELVAHEVVLIEQAASRHVDWCGQGELTDPKFNRYVRVRLAPLCEPWDVRVWPAHARTSACGCRTTHDAHLSFDVYRTPCVQHATHTHAL